MEASIDDDLGLTGLAIGVDTALNTIVEDCDKIADTATARGRTFLVEVMARDCGYLAMTSAITVGADLALFPEAGEPEAAIIEQIVDTVPTVRRRARDPAQGRGPARCGAGKPPDGRVGASGRARPRGRDSVADRSVLRGGRFRCGACRPAAVVPCRGAPCACARRLWDMMSSRVAAGSRAVPAV